MTDFLVGLALGVGVTALGVLLVVVPLFAQARQDRKEAEDRLYAGWREGLVVGERPGGMPPTPEPDPLPEALQAFVDAWESPMSRLAEETRIRGLLAKGWDAERITHWLSDPTDQQQ